MRLLLLPVATFALFTACTVAIENPQDLARELRNVGLVHENWAADLNDKRIDQIMTLYADDAVFLRPTLDRATGWTASRSLFQKTLATNTPHIVFHPITIERSDNLAYDCGTYEETILSNGVSRAARGDYILILRRQSDGRWLI